MKKVALISDTHSYLDQRALPWLEKADEIWHAGDIGNLSLLSDLEKITTCRAVFGNIDPAPVRSALEETLVFILEGLKVMITHIGGYPGRYASGIPDLISRHKPGLFISGHSHILKVIYDKKYELLHMNPGALGKQGIHQVQTLLFFSVHQGKVSDLQVVEFKRIKRSGT